MVKSLGVAILSIFLYFYPHIAYIDAIYTIIISVVIIYTTIALIDDCVHARY